MKVLLYPDHLVFVTDLGCDEIVSIQQLLGWNRTAQFSRAPTTTVSIEASGWCSLEVGHGVFELRINDGSILLVLLPHGVFITERVARELLRHPTSFPPIPPAPRHIARALGDLLAAGLSWAVATRVFGLGPYGDSKFLSE